MDGSPSNDHVLAVKNKIEAIPGAMRNMGWRVSAELMERWLRSPHWVLPSVWKSTNPPDPGTLSPKNLDQSIVRMSWAMSNPRIRAAMKALRVSMANGPARAHLARRIAKLPWGSGCRVDFGARHHSAVQLEQTCQSNFERFGDFLDTMDDLYGGIGIGTLKVALIGTAMRDIQTGKLSLQVTHAGFYIRDTYDFHGFQYLGMWSRSGVLSKAGMLLNAASDGLAFHTNGDLIGNVFNYHFDAYRRLTGFGGDFVIYSDVYWEPANFVLELS
jgi:hypothetical protein